MRYLWGAVPQGLSLFWLGPRSPGHWRACSQGEESVMDTRDRTGQVSAPGSCYGSRSPTPIVPGQRPRSDSDGGLRSRVHRFES